MIKICVICGNRFRTDGPGSGPRICCSDICSQENKTAHNRQWKIDHGYYRSLAYKANRNYRRAKKKDEKNFIGLGALQQLGLLKRTVNKK